MDQAKRCPATRLLMVHVSTGAAAIAFLTGLQHLNLSSNPMWDDACLAALTSLPALQFLGIAHCYELTSAALTILAPKAPGLTR